MVSNLSIEYLFCNIDSSTFLHNITLLLVYFVNVKLFTLRLIVSLIWCMYVKLFNLLMVRCVGLGKHAVLYPKRMYVAIQIRVMTLNQLSTVRVVAQNRRY